MNKTRAILNHLKDNAKMLLNNNATIKAGASKSVVHQKAKGLGITLGWDIIVGFPGETNKLFNETYGEPFEVHILCKVNNGKWQSISFDDGEVTLPNAGDRVYFKAGTEDDENVTNDHFASFNAGGVAGFIDSSHRFAVPKGSAELGGNIMSLLDGKNFSTKVTLPKGTAVDDMPVAVEFQLK